RAGVFSASCEAVPFPFVLAHGSRIGLDGASPVSTRVFSLIFFCSLRSSGRRFLGCWGWGCLFRSYKARRRLTLVRNDEERGILRAEHYVLVKHVHGPGAALRTSLDFDRKTLQIFRLPQ